MSDFNIGFVHPEQIPCPDGRLLPLNAIAATDRSMSAAYDTNVRRVVADTQFNGDMNAAADHLGPGSIQVPRYETQILDQVRRRAALGQRIKQVPATGHPTRYFEQRTIVAGGFTDPRAITQSPETPFRAERAAMLKAISAQVNFSIFDAELTRQQAIHPNLVAKDVLDMVMGMLRTSDKALWRGTDTNVALPTTNQYMGGFGATFGTGQINRTFSVASSASIVDAIKAEVASIVSNEDFEATPTAIYAHPQTIEVIEAEERVAQRQMTQMPVRDREQVTIGGLIVSAIATAAGLLPLIPDWSVMAPATPGQEGAGSTDYFLAIVSEDLIEYHYLTSAEPRVFVLGLEGSLATQYVGVMFGAPIFKGRAGITDPEDYPSAVTYAHSIGRITRT